MTAENQSPTPADSNPSAFGERLKSARETLGIDRRDAAAQLRLNEKVIIMMEKNRYPSDLPVTFIRGYLRLYAKFLQIPEFELKQALEPIKPKPLLENLGLGIKPLAPINSSSFFMQFFTYLIVFTLIGLLGTWWYKHSAFVTNEAPVTSFLEPQTSTPIAPPVQEAAAPPAPIPAQPQPLIPVEANVANPASVAADTTNPPPLSENPGTQSDQDRHDMTTASTETSTPTASPLDNAPQPQTLDKTRGDEPTDISEDDDFE